MDYKPKPTEAEMKIIEEVVAKQFVLPTKHGYFVDYQADMYTVNANIERECMARGVRREVL